MATIDGRELDLTAPGAVLFLTTVARREWIEQLPNDVTVATATGSRAAIVTGLETHELEDISGPARRLVNEALDLMAVRSLGVYTLTDLASPVISWAQVGDQVRLRTTSEVSMTLTGRAGGLPNPPPTRWHPSMRYFRLSQTTTDLFDAFRNLYLALESLLSTIEPVLLRQDGRPKEHEGAWLKRALTTAERTMVADNTANHLNTYLTAPGAATCPNAVDRVLTDLYQSVRTTVFHAKSGRSVALPHHQPDRAAVADALDRYTRFFLALAESVLGVRFLQTGLGPIAADAAAKGFLSNVVIEASADTSPWTDHHGIELAAAFNPAAAAFDQAASPITMSTYAAPELSAPFATVVRGELAIAGSETPDDFTIASLGTRNQAGELTTGESLGGTLTLEHVDVWEHVLTFRAAAGGRKVNYSS